MTGEDKGVVKLCEYRDSVAIVVSSCDAFFDAWRPFAFFFRKFWPDCPFPVYLIVNELRIQSNFVRAIPVGPDLGWASNMKTALETLDVPRVLYLQEDYFLNAPVRSDVLEADFAFAFEKDAAALCFRAREHLEPGFQPLNDRFGIVPVDSDGRTRCQLTLWKRDALLSVLREGESAWEMESRGSARSREMDILSYAMRENAPIRYLMSAIVRGLWTREALAMCREAKIEIEPRLRGTYSSNQFIRRWRRARMRSRLPRVLANQQDRTVDLEP